MHHFFPLFLPLCVGLFLHWANCLQLFLRHPSHLQALCRPTSDIGLFLVPWVLAGAGLPGFNLVSLGSL